MKTFEDYAYYYNLIYKDKNYESEARQIHKFMQLHETPIRKILDLGCGTGRHDMELIKLGYQIHGVDLSGEMIRIANENATKLNELTEANKITTENNMAEVNKITNAHKITFEQADIRRYQSEIKYDAVISMFHVMSYQNSNDDILQSFQTAANVLPTGGYFLFDVWYGPGVLTDLPAIRVKEVEDEQNKIIRIAKPDMAANENIVRVNYEVLVINKQTDYTRVINETHSMRYFFIPELELMLKLSGFELIKIYDGNNMCEEPGYHSWTACCAAVRR